MPDPEKISEVTAENAELDRLDEALFNRVGGGLRTRRSQINYLAGPVNREWSMRLVTTEGTPSGADDNHGELTAFNFSLQVGESIQGVIRLVVFATNDGTFTFLSAWGSDDGGSIDGWLEDASTGTRANWNSGMETLVYSNRDATWMVSFYAENTGAGQVDISFAFGSASLPMHIEAGATLTARYLYRPIPD